MSATKRFATTGTEDFPIDSFVVIHEDDTFSEIENRAEALANRTTRQPTRQAK